MSNVVHELGHVLDNKVGYYNKLDLYEKALESGLPFNPFIGIDATIVGGGLADDLFIAMGGNPDGIRFRNGSSEYLSDTGVNLSLGEENRFPDGQYGNAGSAEYFAETWTAAILGTTGRNEPPQGAIDWIAFNLP